MAQKVEIEIRLDNRNFAEDANKVKLEISAIARQTESEGGRMGSVFDNLGKKVAGAFAVSKLIEFEKKVISVRSEMESLQKSFESLAGEQIGRKLYEDIKQFATTTPMMMNDLAKGAQTLLGFNIEAEKIMPILREIGDISMGDAQKFNSLTLAFAQMSSTGKLMGQDLLQMINAGFNPLVVMAEKSGKSVAQLKDEMSKGLITVEMVEDAFRTATAEGGKFHNMLEAQSKTMRGALSNLQGAYNDMLNEIGEKQQGLMLEGVELAQSLVKNYEKVGQVLLGIITTYGTYRAAVMAVNVAEGIHTGQIVLKIRALRAAAAAQALLNKTMLANPYVLAATALGVLVGSIIAARDGLTDAERAQRDYNKTLEEAKQRQKEYNDETQDAIRLAQDDSAATEDREGAMKTLIARYPEIIQKYIDEKGHLTDILKLKREIAAYDGQMANEDNKINADLYKRYIEVIKKNKAGESLTETEKILLEGANKKYGDATPWYKQFSGSWSDDSIKYFTSLWKQAQHAYGRGKTEARVNNFMETMGDMKTEDLKKLVSSLSKSASRIKKDNQVVKVDELGDVLNSSDLQSLITKANGIINARTKPKKNPTSAEKAAAQKAAEEAAARRQKLFEIEQKQAEEQAAKERELKDALTNFAIASESDNARREAMQMEKDHQDKIDAINRQSEEWKKAAYKAAEERFNATNTDKTKVFSDTAEGKAGWQGQGLTKDQDKIIKAQLGAENAIYSRYVEERYANERQATYDFLKTWGDYEQQKWAITQEYEEKIRKASSPTEAAGLSLQRNEELKKLEADKLMDGIDWGGVFSDLQGHTREYLISLRDQLQSILNTGNLPVDQMATIQEKIREINGEINQQNGLFQFQGDRAREHKRLLQEEEDARKRLIDLQMEQTENEYKVEEATKKIRDFLSGAGLDSDTDIEDGLLSQFDPNSEQYKQAAAMLTNLRVAEGMLADSRKKTEKATSDAKKAEDKAKRSSSQAVADWFSDAQQFIAEKGIDQIPDLLNNLGLESLGEKASQGLSAFNNAAGAAADFSSGNYIGAATKALSAIKDVGSMLGIGGDSDKTLQKDIERLTAANGVLTNAVNELADKMGGATIIDAMKIYKDQIEYTKEERDNTKEMMWRSAHASSTGWWGLGIGSSSSSENEINEAMSSAEWQRISRIVGRTVKSARDFFSLTSKEMYSVFLNASDIYAKIKDYADDGYKDAAQFMDQYIEYWKELEELETAYYQKLTNTTFDSLRDQFKSSVMDMDSDQKTLAENFEKYMKDAIFESMMLENYDEPLKAWWKKFGDYMKTGGTIDFDEQNGLREDWDKLVTAALEERNRLYETMGWPTDGTTGQQSASVQAMERINVDQANDIVGRLNAGQMIWQQGNNQRDIIIQNIAVMHEVVSGGGRHLGEMVTLMQFANGHLADIVDYCKKMYDGFGDQLEEVTNQIKKLNYA